jgi:hypothetical protein
MTRERFKNWPASSEAELRPGGTVWKASKLIRKVGMK